MLMLMMCIRKMSMSMCQWFMMMQMAMLATRGCLEIVLMLVMFVVSMIMVMHQLRMYMPVFMVLGQMQPST